MPTLLVCSGTDDLQSLRVALAQAAALVMPDLQVRLWPEAVDPHDVLAVAAWHPPAGVLNRLPQLQLIASIGAGVEHVLRVPDLPAQVAISRIVDSQQARGMAEFVLWATLHYHRQMDQVLRQHAQRVWRMPAQRAASECRVGIMGLGVMGEQAARCLRDNGFAVSGWSRSKHSIAGVDTYAGAGELPAFLAPLDVVVCLLPLTASTLGICNTAFFQMLKPGAALVNAGRGEHVVTDDLLAALDSGHLRGAVLDTFAQEPLPPEDPLWNHPGILITPHMASAASETEIARQIVDNVARLRSGKAALHTIDRERRY